MKLGLRVDVDTLRGTRDGVPRLLKLFQEQGITASIFFSVGPDNMGRHIWRLLHPSFFWKMVRSSAPALYGWEILLRGTLIPGPKIADRCAEIIRSAAENGHEIGLHAWDHHAWQSQIEQMSASEIEQHLREAFNAISRICGSPPVCSAVPGWKCTETVLLQKEKFPFRYNSDCRGEAPFLPQAKEQTLSQPQIPVTLPTYDEWIGRNGITDANYNALLLEQIESTPFPVLTIHAEVEGIQKYPLFQAFLRQCRKRDIQPVPLSALLPENQKLPTARIQSKPFPGREGTLAVQS